MNLDVQRVPSDGYWDNYWLKAPVHFGNINPRPTPDILFSLLYASDAPWNESQYKSEKFDKHAHRGARFARPGQAQGNLRRRCRSWSPRRPAPSSRPTFPTSMPLTAN